MNGHHLLEAYPSRPRHAALIHEPTYEDRAQVGIGIVGSAYLAPLDIHVGDAALDHIVATVEVATQKPGGPPQLR